MKHNGHILPQFAGVSKAMESRKRSDSGTWLGIGASPSADKGEFNEASHLERNKDEEVRKEEENEKAMDMVNDDGPSGLILLLVCQPELVWQQVIAFIRPLRAEYQP